LSRSKQAIPGYGDRGRQGRSTQNRPVCTEQLRSRGAGLRVPNLHRGDADIHARTGAMVFTVMTTLAQLELKIESTSF
jgi:hypothetical protein